MNFRNFAALIILAAFALPISTSGHAKRAMFDCRTTDVKVTTSNRSNSTDSIDLTAIPDMVVSFVQGKRGCVIVELQAFARARLDDLMLVHARLDDGRSNYVGPSTPTFAANDQQSGFVRLIKFIWPDVLPGHHSVRIFYSNGVPPGSVEIQAPMMFVNYTK